MAKKETKKGNWAVFYDGKDTGLILNGRMLDDSTIEKMGWEHHEKDTDNKEEENSKKNIK